MQNLSDNELDELFRKAAAHGGPPYDPADWEALSKRLDGSQPPRRWAKWKIPGILTLLIITSGIIVWNYNDAVITTSTEIAAETGVRENTPTPSGTTDATPADDNLNGATPLTGRPSLPKAGETRFDGKTTIAEENTRVTEQKQPLTPAHRSAGENSNNIIHQSDRTTHIPAVEEAQTEQTLRHRSAAENPKNIIRRSDRPTHIPAVEEAPAEQTSRHRSAGENPNSIIHRNDRTAHIPAVEEAPAEQTSRHRSAGESSNDTIHRSGRTTDMPTVGEASSEQDQPLTSKRRITGEDPDSIIQQHDRTTNIPRIDEAPYVQKQPLLTVKHRSTASYDSAADTRTNPASTGTNKTTHSAQPVTSSTPEISAGTDHVAARKRRHQEAAGPNILSDSTVVMDSTTVTSIEKSDSVQGATVEASEEEAVQNRYRLGIKLAVSPDYSSVRFTALSGTGTNYGVLAEYHLTPHWSVVTGGIWSRKIYSATDVEYNGYRVDRADGDCRILDIPLNVNYVFKPDRNFSFYASVGFSTYIMNKEDYVFHVDSGYGSTSYSKNVRGKNNELFSIVNVSVGAQKKITDRWAIQLEPFVKVPVKGIGEGNLSLNTLGAFFHLKYSFYNMNNP